MPIRVTVENALTRELMTRRGMRYHFRFGTPVVFDTNGAEVDAEVYRETQRLARDLFEMIVDRIDFNRLVVEACGAFEALTDRTGDKLAEFGIFKPRLTGRAIRLALLADETFPTWNDVIDADEAKK